MVKMEVTNEEILQKFPNKLQRIVKQLWLDGNIGISCLNPKIVKFDDLPQRVRFVIEVPYAGKQLNWEVIFDDDDLNFAPDFHFINDHFLVNPDIDVIENEIPSLAKWNLEDNGCLVSVIKELLALYKTYQLERLREAKFQRQETEYNLLTGEAGVDSECIEVYIDPQDNVHFLIRIEVDTKEFPPYVQPLNEADVVNPGEDAATLKVSFVSSRVSTCLQLSPRLQSVIGASHQLHIPAYSKDSGLIEYVPAIVDLIKSTLRQITRNFKLRSEYISTLLAYQGHSVVEYDSSMFMKATLLLEMSNDYTLVSIHLSKNFPQETPTIRLFSIYYEKNGDPMTKEYNSYPFDGNSCPEVMVQKMLNFVRNAIPTFKKSCTPPSSGNCSQ